MGQNIPKPPLTEPVIIQCQFCTGLEVEMLDTDVRIVGWEDLPTLDTDQPERRIVLRIALPNEVARDLQRQLQRALSKGGH